MGKVKLKDMEPGYYWVHDGINEFGNDEGWYLVKSDHDSREFIPGSEWEISPSETKDGLDYMEHDKVVRIEEPK